MKVTNEHYHAMLKAMSEIGIDAIDTFQIESISQNKTQTFFVWEIFFMSKFYHSDIAHTPEFRKYNDAHLDTAITKAVKEILGDKYKF